MTQARLWKPHQLYRTHVVMQFYLSTIARLRILYMPNVRISSTGHSDLLQSTPRTQEQFVDIDLTPPNNLTWLNCFPLLTVTV
jgi:hypothetical protein